MSEFKPVFRIRLEGNVRPPLSALPLGRAPLVRPFTLMEGGEHCPDGLFELLNRLAGEQDVGAVDSLKIGDADREVALSFDKDVAALDFTGGEVEMGHAESSLSLGRWLKFWLRSDAPSTDNVEAA